MNSFFSSFILVVAFFVISCNNTAPSTNLSGSNAADSIETPQYFLLRPALEKQYGYSHAVRIGKHLKISGAVSMNDSGIVIGPNNMEQQMKNCYGDLGKILQHYGYSFDDVYAENIYTTNMKEFIKVAGLRNDIYKRHFPTGTWLEVKGLALDNQLIEIDMEATK